MNLTLSLALGSGGGARATIMPATLTIPFGALTRVGYGGHDLEYTGDKWLQVYSVDGATVTNTPYGTSTAATQAQPWRVNRENRFVITGPVATSTTAPPPLNASYTVVIREYPSEADAAARTNWTGVQQALTVVCAGAYVLPARTITTSTGSVFTFAEHTIPDLANCMNVYEFPCGGATPGSTTLAVWDPVRYPSGYTTTDETLLIGQGNSCQLKRVSWALGSTLLLMPGSYNVPYEDGVHNGTVDVGISGSDTGVISIAKTPTGVWAPGTAPLHEDANFVTVAMLDPERTEFGQYYWDTAYVRFTYCRWRTYRPTLRRTSFATDLTGNSSDARGAWFGRKDAAQYIKHDNSVVDPVIHSPTAPYNGGTVVSSSNTTNGYYFVAGGGTSTIQKMIFDGVHVANGRFGIFANGGTMTGTNSINGVLIRNSYFDAAIAEDAIKLTSCYNMDVQDNLIFKADLVGHPDFMQITSGDSVTVMSVAFGTVSGNMMITLDDSEGGQGIFMSNVGSVTYTGAVIENNFIRTGFQNAIDVANLTSPTIRNNVAICTEARAGEQARIFASGGVTGATVEGNVHAYGTAVSVGTAEASNANNLYSVRRSGGLYTYDECFAAPPALGVNTTTEAAIIAAWKAKTGGPLMTPASIGVWDDTGTPNP